MHSARTNFAAEHASCLDGNKALVAEAGPHHELVLAPAKVKRHGGFLHDHLGTRNDPH